MLSLLLAPAALAQTYITDISEEILIDVGGGWNRTHPAEEGWHFLFAAGGDYNHSAMPEDFVWQDTQRTPLTGRSDLQDHGVVRCPDGTWLHAASATTNVPDDSAYAWRYGEAFERLAETTVAEGDASRKHNDLLVACTPNLRLLGFTSPTLRGGDALLYDEDLNLLGTRTLEQAPTLSGSAALHDPDTGGILLVGFEQGSEDQDLKFTRYDADLAFIDQVRVDVRPPGQRCYWSQGFLRLGEHFAVAYVCRDDGAGWEGDTGDVWVSIFGPDFEVLESHNVTRNTAPQGGMRPFLTRKGEQLLMSYDKAIRPRMHLITLDLAAFGLAVGEDTGWSGDSGTREEDKDCGCSGGGAAGGGLAWALAALALSRRRGPRSARA